MQNDVLRGEDWNPEERATFIASTVNKEERCSISRQPNDTSCEEDAENFTILRGTCVLSSIVGHGQHMMWIVY